jgi:hypothetical protein
MCQLRPKYSAADNPSVSVAGNESFALDAVHLDVVLPRVPRGFRTGPAAVVVKESAAKVVLLVRPRSTAVADLPVNLAGGR